MLDGVIAALRDPHEPWLTAADFRSFVDVQRQVDRAWAEPTRWTAMSIRNTAASGRFSTDRTMREYNRDIWRLEALSPQPGR